MKRHFRVAIFCMLSFFVSCINKEHISFENNFVSKGGYDNKGLEVGKWQVFNKSDNRLIEEGNFSDGLRIGEWHYNIQTSDTIVWTPFNSKSGTIKTNIPNFLKLVEENENLIRFNYMDSDRLFNLVIGKNYINDSTSLEKYQNLIYTDLSNRRIHVIDSATNYIETSQGKKYLFSFIDGSSLQSEDFILLNIAGQVNGEFIEISLRCDKKYNSKARKVFFSVLPNLFLNSHRFITPEDMITNLSNIR